jgi:hypothetical protein
MASGFLGMRWRMSRMSCKLARAAANLDWAALAAAKACENENTPETSEKKLPRRKGEKQGTVLPWGIGFQKRPTRPWPWLQAGITNKEEKQ